MHGGDTDKSHLCVTGRNGLVADGVQIGQRLTLRESDEVNIEGQQVLTGVSYPNVNQQPKLKTSISLPSTQEKTWSKRIHPSKLRIRLGGKESKGSRQKSVGKGDFFLRLFWTCH